MRGKMEWNEIGMNDLYFIVVWMVKDGKERN